MTLPDVVSTYVQNTFATLEAANLPLTETRDPADLDAFFRDAVRNFRP